MILLSTFSHGVPNPDASQKGVVLDQPFRYPHVRSVNLDTGSRHGDEPRNEVTVGDGYRDAFVAVARIQTKDNNASRTDGRDQILRDQHSELAAR